MFFSISVSHHLMPKHTHLTSPQSQTNVKPTNTLTISSICLRTPTSICFLDTNYKNSSFSLYSLTTRQSLSLRAPHQISPSVKYRHHLNHPIKTKCHHTPPSPLHEHSSLTSKTDYNTCVYYCCCLFY